MARAILSFFIFGLSLSLLAQAEYEFTPNVKTYKQWKVNLSEGDHLLELAATKNNFIAPEPVMRSKHIKQKLDAQRQRKVAVKTKTDYSTTKEEVTPTIEDDFTGRPVGGSGIPNDNSMAISNNGTIISVINTTITILNEQGDLLKFRTLSGIVAGQLGLLDRFYDPKVTYDPIEDRFILVFLEGSNSNDTRIVVGFTQTNDPTGDWNFYALNGKPLGGQTWSDYPIIAHNKQDLYITVNLLRDNESWQEGFVESFIWQVNKADGYAGEELTTNLFSGIKFNNKSVWSICPVQPALDFNQDNMYFLSVRPDAESNDTVFLHEVTNTSTSGSAEYKLTVLKTDTKYGVPPSAYQPEVGFRLQTNDTRVLSAINIGKDIHYVQSTILEDEIKSGIYHGLIKDVESSPTILGSIISSETLDYAYPSIAFAGEDAGDKNSMLITFSHVGEQDYAGTSAVFHNRAGSKVGLFSDAVMVKEGEGIINTFVADTNERWGDYTDIQAKYNEPGIVWLCGSYGDERDLNNVWLAKMKVNNNLATVDQYLTYPNPANSAITVAASFPSDDVVTLRLSDTRGTIVKERANEPVSEGYVEFQLNTTGISSGIYVLSIVNDKGEKLHGEKIIIE